MSARPLRPLLALAGAAVLSLGLMGSAVAQDDAASPAPATETAAERQADREAARAERRAERAERRDERAERREERAATRETRRTERAAAREDRGADRAVAQARRAELRAAWREVRADCAAELKAIRGDDAFDRAARREALAAARTACRETLAAAREEYRAATSASPAVAASDGTGVVRTDLGIAEPGSAPGEELGLWHYLIAARTDLAPHTHPGWQLARVVRGELEYTVLEGEGILLRGAESEPMGPGTYVLAAGDGVIENPDLVHEASNRSNRPVTIISATLFPAGAEPSTLVEEEPEAPTGDAADPEAPTEDAADPEAPTED